MGIEEWRIVDGDEKVGVEIKACSGFGDDLCLPAIDRLQRQSLAKTPGSQRAQEMISKAVELQKSKPG